MLNKDFRIVVCATTKVIIFEQITTYLRHLRYP